MVNKTGASGPRGEFATRRQLARSTLTELVHRAEDLGLVRRELDRRQRRAVFVALTEEGERRLAGAVSELGSERHRLIAIVSQLEGRLDGGSSASAEDDA